MLFISADWSPDGRVLFARGDAIVLYDPVTRREETLYQRPRAPGGHLALSTDGQRLAFWRDATSLVILPVSGGPASEVLRVPEPEELASKFLLAWMPDNQHLLFSKRAHELWRVDIQTGQQQQIGEPVEHLQFVDVHPDGRQLAISLEQPGSELWVMEGFLPDP